MILLAVIAAVVIHNVLYQKTTYYQITKGAIYWTHNVLYYK